MRLFIIFLLQSLTSFAFSNYRQVNFEKIDQYALKTPVNIEYNLPKLTTYLTQNCTSDIEKTRAIFIWIASHIKYDEHAYASGIIVSKVPEEVLKRKKAVCEGYSALFQKMCELAGLENKTIIGYGKGRGYVQGSVFNRTNHSWNLVKINGKWELFDVTWARNKMEFEKYKFNSNSDKAYSYFATFPEVFIFSHYPLEEQFTFLKNNITLKQFEQLQFVDIYYFFLNFDLDKVLKSALNDTNFKFPDVFNHDIELQIIEGPFQKDILKDKPIIFKLTSKSNLEIALVENNTFHDFIKISENIYEITIKPTQNFILAAKKTSETKYSTILKFYLK